MASISGDTYQVVSCTCYPLLSVYQLHGGVIQWCANGSKYIGESAPLTCETWWQYPKSSGISRSFSSLPYSCIIPSTFAFPFLMLSVTGMIFRACWAFGSSRVTIVFGVNRDYLNNAVLFRLCELRPSERATLRNLTLLVRTRETDAQLEI